MDSDTTNLPEEPSFFVFSSEAALVIVLGIVSFITYIYFIIKSGIFTSFFEAIGRRFPILNINHGNENPQDAQARRIHSDECSICFMPITYEVGAACGHIFCGKCIIDYWLTRQHRKLTCPLCRKEINMLIRNFNINDLANNPELRTLNQNIKYYNATFSNKRDLRQIIEDAPFYLRRFASFLTSWEGFVFFLKKVLTSLYILALLAYIISPFDLIPDFILVVGWIDDLIAFFVILLYITVLYYNFLRDRHMSLEDGIKGVSILSKPQWTTQFRELLALNFSEPWEKYDIDHREVDWDNIPFVIPKSIIVLERKVGKIQQWAKVKHQEIEKLMTNEFFDQLRAEIRGEKQIEMKWKEELQRKFDYIGKNIRELFDLDMKRNEMEAREISDEEFFDKFVGHMERYMEKFEAPEYEMSDFEGDRKLDFEKLRKFSFRQLRHFFFKFLNRSQLNSHVDLIDIQIKKIEEKLELLAAKDKEIEKKIMTEKTDLRESLLPKFEDVYHHLDTTVVPRLTDFEEMLSNVLQNIDEMKTESEENKAFRENLIHKVDDVNKRTHQFTTSFEAKLAKMNDDIKILKGKTEERLNEFESLFNNNVEKMINEFDEENGKQKNEFLERMQEFQKDNKEFLEKFSVSITKNVNVMQFETKRSLESYKEELTRNITQFHDSNREMERKLTRFIEKFETYSKTKIEPAFQNQAKILLLESRVQEQEIFGTKSSMFLKEICSKLVQSLINYNSSNKRREDSLEKKLKSDFQNSFYITENLNLNKENDSDNGNQKNTDSQSQSKFSPYEGFGLRANLNNARFKNSKNKFVPIGVEGNTVMQNVPPKSATMSESNPRDRISSMDLRMTDAFQKNISETMTKFMKDKGKTFDPIFHKKLDIILRALKDDSSQAEMKKSDSLESKDPIKNFKDINLVRITERGISRGRKSAAVNKTFSEFDDNHLL